MKSSKSFLVLFFKKEMLTFSFLTLPGQGRKDRRLRQQRV
jgi:hypothetical protein